MTEIIDYSIINFIFNIIFTLIGFFMGYFYGINSDSKNDSIIIEIKDKEKKDD